MRAISADVTRKLGWYVYAYVNSSDGKIFYVGKGKGRRALSHVKHHARMGKVKTPRIDILAHGLGSEEAALRTEAAVIDALGVGSLTNEVRGWQSSRYGRTPLEELVAHYQKKPLRKIKERCILIRINDLYRPQMNAEELYDATRGVWRIGHKGDRAKYALAVFEGVVREVYEIKGPWLEAGSTFSTRNPKGVRVSDRYEFVGRVAPARIRRQYIDRDVSRYFKTGARNPIRYTF